MNKKILWPAVSGLTILSLVLAACGQATSAPPVPTAPADSPAPAAPVASITAPPPAAEKPPQEAVKPADTAPRYGGTLTFITTSEAPTTKSVMGGFTADAEGLWGGDWSKGPAGGYGSKEADWGYSFTDIWQLKAGYVAESWKWSIDGAANEGSVVYQIRPGIHYALSANNEGSRLANGRELTADDVVYAITTITTDPNATIYRANPELRAAKATKTGDREVTVKIPVSGLANAIFRLSSQILVVPPEVVARYQNTEIQSRWKYAVGSGPYYVSDYTPGSVWTYARNGNYWMKDPIGPGKGNQLPYLDGFRRLIIPDRSTQLAALRTGKVDQMTGLNPDEVGDLERTAPKLLQATTYPTVPTGVPLTTTWNITKEPFTDVRVRRAMMMSIDFGSLNKFLAFGQGEIINWPFLKQKGYEGLYLGIDDPELPASVKEIYTYSPEKAKQLLKEAGFPNGFKTSVLTTSTYVDFYSIIKDSFSKVGIDLAIDVRETGTFTSMRNNRTFQGLINIAAPPPSIFYVGNMMSGTSSDNPLAETPDPVIEKALTEMREVVITKGLADAMPMMKELQKYVLGQALAFGSPRVMLRSMWWPWVRNYSGELSGGYGSVMWEQFIWLDQDMKKSMGR